MAEKTGSITDIFWGAAAPESPDRSPIPVVRHALNCLEAFEAGLVESPKSGKPITLLELLADVGIEEDLVYASPELVRGEAFDERSLVFTMAVLIFERFTGKHPFGTSDNPKRLARLRRGEMGSGVNYIPQVPSDLRVILMRAMGPFPEERYKSVQEFRHALRRFAGLSQPSIKPLPRAGKGQPKFFEAPTRVATHPLLDDQGRPLDPESPSSQQASADWLQPKRDDETPVVPVSALKPEAALGDAEAPTGSADAPPTAKASVTDQELESLFDDLAEKKPETDQDRGRDRDQDQAPPLAPLPPAGRVREQRSTDQVRALPRPGLVTSVTAAPGVLAPEARPTTLSKLMPLIYGLAGAAVATVLIFVITGRGGDPKPTNADLEGRAKAPATERPGEGSATHEVTRLKTAKTAKTAPTGAAPAAPEPDSPAPAKPEPAAPEPAKPEPAAPEPEPEPAAPEPAKPEPAPAPAPAPTGGETPALASGQQVFATIRTCVPEKARSLRVAVYLLPGGKVLRAFVAKNPGVAAPAVKCMKDKLKGLMIPIKLPKPGYVEWLFRKQESGTSIRLVRPKQLPPQ